ncbi:MAG: sulfatase [Candidatus Latescibacteria bacterium]|nr:sulfatase [Candidatus Latescibacterota bacterium]
MNIITIMLDSLRTDHLGAYAGDLSRAQTPHIDRFAEESLVFDRAYTGSFPTLPCRRDLFTGRWGHPFNTWDEMERDVPTMATIYRQAGYATGLIFDTPMFMTEGNFLDRGFGSIEWIRGQGGEPWISDGIDEIVLPAAEHKVKAEGLRRYLMNQSRRRFESDYLVARTMTEAGHWLERNYTRDNFFLWIDAWDPHEPWDPPQYYVDQYDPGYEGDIIMYPCYGFSDYMTEAELNHVKALYAAEVTMVDRWVGHLLETIRLLGLMKNTIVVLMSDHGHYFGDHGLQGKPWGDLVQLYEPMTHIPFMMSGPGIASRRTQAIVQPVDVFPTLNQLTQMACPDGLQGTSFASVAEGKADAHRQYAVTGRNLDDQWGTVPATVTDGHWTLVYWPNKELSYQGPPVREETYPMTGMPERRKDELFNLTEDPGQELNVLNNHADKARELHGALLELISTTDVHPDIAKAYQSPPA